MEFGGAKIDSMEGVIIGLEYSLSLVWHQGIQETNAESLSIRHKKCFTKWCIWNPHPDVQGSQYVEWFWKLLGLHWIPSNCNIGGTLVGNEIVDHSDVVGHRLLALLQIHLNSRLNTCNVLSKENCDTRRETFKFWDFVQIILQAWWWCDFV